MNKIENNEEYSNKSFESIKHIDENGIEYWSARELQGVLDYKEWRKFENVIKKLKKHAKTAVLVRLNILSVPTKRYQCLRVQPKALLNIN